jgi:hypothetical protein
MDVTAPTVEMTPQASPSGAPRPQLPLYAIPGRGVSLSRGQSTVGSTLGCVVCRGQPAVFGMPIRRNQRKCEPIPARNELCSVYLIPNSRQVCSTSLDIAG